MKYLLVVDDFFPHSTKIAAKMMHELALELQEQGHEATVLTPSTNIDSGYKFEEVQGVPVLFFKTGAIKNVNLVKRAINETLLSLRAWKATKKYLKNNPHDGIIYYSPSIFFGYLVRKIKSLWKVNAYLVLRDIFPQWTLDNGMLHKHSPIYAYFKFFEQLTYKQANKIGVMSPSNLNFFKEKGCNIDHFEVLYNWAKVGEHQETHTSYRIQLGLEDKVVFFYGGNMGHAQDMMNLVRLATRLKEDTRAHFLFVGNGDEVNLLLKAKEEYQLENLTYLPPVDQKTYFDMLKEFDVGLFTLHASHKTHNFPGKILGYLEYAKPILGSVNPGNDLKPLINKAQAGFIHINGEDECLHKSALQLIDSNTLRVKLGQNARTLLNKQFSSKSAVKQITDFFIE